MKIAMLSTVCWRTPPRHYGPWEQVASNITEGLVRRGIDVTLFATGDSVTAGKLEWTCPRPVYEDKNLDKKVEEYLHISTCYEHAAEFDIIHSHYDFMGLVFSKLVQPPVVTTVHGFSSPKIHPLYEKYNNHVHYVSISNADRLATLNYTATVYNGINPAHFTFSPQPGEYLVFLGRISAEKGTHLAIEVAQQVGMPLIIAGIIQDQGYFDALVKPHIDWENIQYVGPVGPKERNKLLSEAYALFHLITFREPFGLTMIEAGACGLPVIAYPLGSVPEIVVNGKTGYLVNSIEEAVKAIPEVTRINRTDCRKHVEEYFSIEKMIDGYLKVYEQVISE